MIISSQNRPVSQGCRFWFESYFISEIVFVSVSRHMPSLPSDPSIRPVRHVNTIDIHYYYNIFFLNYFSNGLPPNVYPLLKFLCKSYFWATFDGILSSSLGLTPASAGADTFSRSARSFICYSNSTAYVFIYLWAAVLSPMF